MTAVSWLRRPGRSRSRFVASLAADRRAMIALGMIVIVAIALAAAPLIAPFDPNDQDLSKSLQGPGWPHLLGTDMFGRDTLSRLLYGGRVSLVAALEATLVAGVLGIPTGLYAGTVGGWIDNLMGRLAEALLSIPGLVLVLGFVGIRGIGLTNAMIALGIVLAPDMFRITRAATADLRGENFVLASRSLGCSETRLMARHLLPNIAGPLLVQVSFTIGLAIVAEGSLSFLGVGVQLPQASWGSMIAAGSQVSSRSLWPAVAPSAMLLVTVLSLFLLADGLRDSTGRKATALP